MKSKTKGGKSGQPEGMTLEKKLTKRGVLWLGQTCNLRCYFCYFISKIKDKEHPEHRFMSIEKAKSICKTLREVYGNTAVDIQGGEPTIYPEIYELVRYCREIGLRPTLITNAIVLADESRCRALKEAGIHDLLVSTHALGETYDSIVGLKGGSERQLQGIENIRKTGIPFRLNCTLTIQALKQIKEISALAVEKGAKAVNFITFNPFADQQGTRDGRHVPRYSEIRKKISGQIDFLESNGIEVNVRYLPICMLSSKHRKNIYDFQQLSYDGNEWDFNSWTWTTRFNQKSADNPPDRPIPILLYETYEHNDINFGDTAKHGTKAHYMREIDVEEHLLKLFSADMPKEMLYRQNAKLRAEKHCGYVYGEKCGECSVRGICDGFHSDYSELFGTDEARPIRLKKDIDDPKYYISKQYKVTDE